MSKYFDSVDSLLKALKRPATAYEIVIAMENSKQRNSVFSEIRTLIKNGTLKKIS